MFFIELTARTTARIAVQLRFKENTVFESFSLNRNWTAILAVILVYKNIDNFKIYLCTSINFKRLNHLTDVMNHYLKKSSLKNLLYLKNPIRTLIQLVNPCSIVFLVWVVQVYVLNKICDFYVVHILHYNLQNISLDFFSWHAYSRQHTNRNIF